jgi:UDP-N-acetylglucosamine 2-epimerase (non-hydrolysing)
MPNRLKVMTVFGTRPEAIKMAPVLMALKAHPETFESILCVTAQHREMLDQVLELFDLQPDVDLDLMRPNQDLYELTSKVLLGMKEVLSLHKPDIVLVHGDTTTTMATSLASFYAQIPVGHVEAGLRTFDKYYPFPEEINRVVTDSVATFFFAPTDRSRQNLLDVGVPESAIYKTGNTVIDALYYTLEKIGNSPLPIKLDPEKRMVLVTVHRRENLGEPMAEICDALKTLVQQNPDIELVIPVHMNPNVRQTVFGVLAGVERVHLIDPLDYAPFCQMMNHAYLVLTDSGGIQEEAPAISKPVLVLRDETERPEAVEMGTVKLVGPHRDRILAEAQRLLDDEAAYRQMAQAVNPYGDGHASERIIQALKDFHQQRQTASPTSQVVKH